MPTDGLAFARANSSAAGSQAGQQAVQNSLLVNTLDMVGRAWQSLTLHQFCKAAPCKIAEHCMPSRCMHVQMRNFEKLGMTREQSERLTRDLTEILCINKDKIAAQFVSKSTLEKVSASWGAAMHLCRLHGRAVYMLHHRSMIPARVSNGCDVRKACTADAALKLTQQSIADKSDMLDDACILVATASNVEVQDVMRAHMLLQAVLEQEARIAGFKSEVQKSQELHHSSLTRDTDRLQTMLDKVKAEIR